MLDVYEMTDSANFWYWAERPVPRHNEGWNHNI